MNTEYEQKLEAAIDAELKRLPEARVPEALMQSVLAAIARGQARPWWQKSFEGWPMLAQVAFLVSIVALVCTSVFAFSVVDLRAEAEPLFNAFSPIATAGSALWSVFMAVANALVQAMTERFGPWLMWGVAIAFSLYASCAAVVVAWYRMAMGQADLSRA